MNPWAALIAPPHAPAWLGASSVHRLPDEPDGPRLPRAPRARPAPKSWRPWALIPPSAPAPSASQAAGCWALLEAGR